MIGEVILKNKLFSGESINIEYKVEMPKKSEKYMKTVVAFANGRGGRIVFGVDDEPCEYLEIDENDIKDLCDKMKKQQSIRRIGTSHKGYWELLINL